MALKLLHKKDGGIFVAETTNIISSWELFYSNLMKGRQSSSLEGSEIYIAEPDIPETSFFGSIIHYREFKKNI